MALPLWIKNKYLFFCKEKKSIWSVLHFACLVFCRAKNTALTSAFCVHFVQQNVHKMQSIAKCDIFYEPSFSCKNYTKNLKRGQFKVYHAPFGRLRVAQWLHFAEHFASKMALPKCILASGNYCRRPKCLPPCFQKKIVAVHFVPPRPPNRSRDLQNEKACSFWTFCFVICKKKLRIK